MKENPNLTEQTERWIEEVKLRDRFWKKKSDQIYERKLSLNDPLLIKINHLRQFFRFYLIPMLEKVLKSSEEEKQRFYHFMPVFYSIKRFDAFIEHFYSIRKKRKEGWQFHTRDPCDQDIYVLHDLFRCKKFLNAATALLEEVQSGKESFPSVFSQEDQISILKNFRAALMLTFRYSLKGKYHNHIFQKITPDCLLVEEKEYRRKNRIIYHCPNNQNGSPWRRIFFHLFFRNRIVTIHKQQAIRIDYSLVDFEQLKQEYLKHWIKKLGVHPEKVKVYKRLYFQGKTFIDMIIENSVPEDDLLNTLTASEFNDLVGEIEENLPPEERPKVESLSSKFGPLKELNDNFRKLLNKIKPSIQRVLTPDPGKILQHLEEISDLVPVTFGNETQKKEELQNGMGKSLLTWSPNYRSGSLYRTGTIETVGQSTLLLINEELFSKFGEAIHESLAHLRFTISTPQDLLKTDLETNDLILTLRAQIPETDSHKQLISLDHIKAEIIDIEIAMEKFPFPEMNESMIEDEWLDQYEALKKRVEGEQSRSVFSNCCFLDRSIWEYQQEQQDNYNKMKTMRKDIFRRYPYYKTVVHWLIFEAMEESGHLKSLVQALAGVNRYLIIDGFGFQTLEYLALVGFKRDLLFTWDYKELEKQIKDFQETCLKKPDLDDDSGYRELLQQLKFQRFDVVFFIDWMGSKPGMIPTYIRTATPHKEKDGKVSCTYMINLCQIFEQDDFFIQRCRQTMKRFYPDKETKFQLFSLNDLSREVKQYQQYYQYHQILMDQKEELEKELKQIIEDSSEMDFEKTLREFFTHRIELFIEAHQIRKKLGQTIASGSDHG